MKAPDQLAYLGFEVSDLPAWRDFAEGVLGLTALDTNEGFRLRLDDRAMRLQLHAGESDDLAFVGWEYREQEHWQAAVDHLGATPRDDLASKRGVKLLALTADVGGIPTELVLGPTKGEEPPSCRYRGGWVASELGLGHVVLSCPSRQEGEDFYRALGFQLTDRIVTQIGPHDIDLAFLNLNPRHHSLALGGPQRKRLHHLMVQLADFDDLGRALHRARRAGCLASTLGRHPNDRMVSFYVWTPSGFQIEVGWGGVELDASWQPQTHDRIAVWGHHLMERT